MKENFKLLPYQDEVLNESILRLDINDDDIKRPLAMVLKSPTGSGKTIMMTAIAEAVFAYSKERIILWLSDSPDLNEQSKKKIINASLPDIINPSILETVHKDSFTGFNKGGFYFINYGKLSSSSKLAKPHERMGNKSIWDHLEELDGNNVIVFIDEAHKGTKVNNDKKVDADDKSLKDNERRTIIDQLLVKINAKRVLGVSATTGDLNTFIEKKNYHVHTKTVAPSDVIKSGVIKSSLSIKSPYASDSSKQKTLYHAFLNDYEYVLGLWHKTKDPRTPLVIIQVPNNFENHDKDKDFLIDELLHSGFFDKSEIKHCFSDERPLTIHTGKLDHEFEIDYMDAQEIIDNNDVKVVIFKDALSEGWDCPRAEFLISIRSSNSDDRIEQTVGRILRNAFLRTPDVLLKHPELDRGYIYTVNYDKDVMQRIKNDFDGNVHEEKVIPTSDQETVHVDNDTKSFIDKLNIKTKVSAHKKSTLIESQITEFANTAANRPNEELSQSSWETKITRKFEEFLLTAVNKEFQTRDKAIEAGIFAKKKKGINHVTSELSIDSDLDYDKESGVSYDIDATLIDRMFDTLKRRLKDDFIYIESVCEELEAIIEDDEIPDNIISALDASCDVRVFEEEKAKLLLVILLDDIKTNALDIAFDELKTYYGAQGIYIDTPSETSEITFNVKNSLIISKKAEKFYHQNPAQKGTFLLDELFVAYKDVNAKPKQSFKIDSTYEYQYLAWLSKSGQDIALLRNPTTFSENALCLTYELKTLEDNFFPDYLIFNKPLERLEVHEIKNYKADDFEAKYKSLYKWVRDNSNKGVMGFFYTFIDGSLYRSNVTADINKLHLASDPMNWKKGHIGEKVI